MSADSKSATEVQNAAQRFAAVNSDSNNLNLTLNREDISLLNECSNNYNKRVSLINTAWLGVGYVLGRVGLFPNFISTHPIIYLGMVVCSYTSQAYLYDDYSKTCEDTFVNSELKTPFAHFVRQHGWPILFNQNSFQLLSQETIEKNTKKQTMFTALYSSLTSKDKKSSDENNENKR